MEQYFWGKYADMIAVYGEAKYHTFFEHPCRSDMTHSDPMFICKK